MRKGKSPNKEKAPYIGVSWVTMQQRFLASVTCDGKYYHCGFHKTAIEAAKARDRKIMALNLNVPLQIFKKIEKLEKELI
jgi:hypothetical protein